MKKLFIKALMGIIAAAAFTLAIPVFSKAAGEPSISLVTDYRNDRGLTYALISNKGSLGEGVNYYVWTLTGTAVDLTDGSSTLNYSETRSGLTDGLYINTGKFKRDHPNQVNITASCPRLGYTYTCTLTIKNDELVNGGFHLVLANSSCLYNGMYNNTIDGYTMPLGYLAKNSVKANLPYGYMDGAEGTLVFNYRPDFVNKSGIVCYNIPEGYLTPNRSFKLATLSDGGIVNVYDDLDLNPATVTANVNFNGYAVILIYTESTTAPLPGQYGITVPVYQVAAPVPASTSPQSYIPLPNYSFERCQQGPACQNIFKAYTPANYIIVDQFSLKTYGTANTFEKNGLVTMNVDNKFSDYKLITVDSNGYTVVLDDIDLSRDTATFPVNFSGFACALVARY